VTSRAFAVLWSNEKGRADKLERGKAAALETDDEPKASVRIHVSE
jgi:hypothetical protein